MEKRVSIVLSGSPEDVELVEKELLEISYREEVAVFVVKENRMEKEERMLRKWLGQIKVGIQLLEQEKREVEARLSILKQEEEVNKE